MDSAPAAAAAGREVAVAVEGEYAVAKTSVWWDIENCQVPRSCDPQLIAQNISSALSSVGYKGPVSISCYGDTGKVSPAAVNALHSTGIGIIHVPSGAKDASDKKILADMIFWAVDNPPPANYLLISGDRDFSYALHQLRMRRYNVLLAQPQCVSSTLVAAAKIVWNWKDLVTGGPPVSNPYTGTTFNSRAQSVEASKEIGLVVENMESLASLSSLNNKKFSNNEKTDNQPKWKAVSWPQNEDQVSGNVPRTFVNELKQLPSGSQDVVADNITSLEKHGVDQKNQAMTSTPEEQENGGSNSKTNSLTPLVSPIKPHPEVVSPCQTETVSIKGAPHELFQANKPETSSSSLPGNNTPLNDAKKKGKPFYKNQSQQSPQPTKVGMFSPRKFPQQGAPSFYLPHTRPDTTPLAPSANRPNSQTFPFATPINLPEINRNNNSASSVAAQKLHNTWNDRSLHLEHSVAPHTRHNSYHNSLHRPPPPNAACGFPGLQHSTEIHTLIGTILNALSILKIDKMAPTELNLKDCICYGEMNKRNFNVKMALDYAIQQQVVVMHKLGNNLPFYIGKNDSLWKCVNPVDINCKHPKAIWDDISNFLSSPLGCSSIMSSECRYHAATLLKKSCLQNLVMGEILQILHVIINNKKWIITNPSGWKPIYLNLPSAGKAARVDADSSLGSHSSSGTIISS